MDLTAFIFLKWMKKIVFVLGKKFLSQVFMFPFPNVAIPKTRKAEYVSVCQSSHLTVLFKAGFVYVPDGEVKQLKDTLPHCCMLLNIAFLASLIM